MDGAPSDVPVNGLGTAAEATDARPPSGDLEAPSAEPIPVMDSQAAASTSRPHEVYLPQRGASAQLTSECFSVPELKMRALSMFVTTSGAAPRVSSSNLNMAAVTALLIVNISKAIEDLMGTPKKPGTHRAEMVRCCGELDKEEARGWLVADAVGRPLLHRNDDRSQNDARDVGKRLLKQCGKAEKDIAAAKEKAAAAVRAAKRAAAKDASQQQNIVDTEKEGAQGIARASSASVDLDLPDATGGSERPAWYWRRREVQEAEAAAATAAAEAAAAAAAEQGAEARLKRMEQAMDRPGASEAATDRWLAEFDVHRTVSETSCAAAQAAKAAAVQAAAVRAAAEAEGVDLRPGSHSKRKREDEAHALAEADAAVAAAVTDMITAVAAYEEAEPYWISLQQWHFIESEVRWTQEYFACHDVAVRQERMADMRARWMANFEAAAEAFETRCRLAMWQAETKEEAAVMELVRRQEAGEDPYDDLRGDLDFDDDLDDQAWDAAMAAYEVKAAALDVLVTRANRVVSERILARTPWRNAYRLRTQGWGDQRIPRARIHD